MSTGTLVTWLLDLYGLVQFPRGAAVRSTHTAEAPVGFGLRGGGGRGRSVITQTSDPHAQILSRPANFDREIFVSCDHFKYTPREVGWWEHVEPTEH